MNLLSDGILSNSSYANVLRREGTKAWPNGPDLRSGFEGIQGFKSLLSHIILYFKYLIGKIIILTKKNKRKEHPIIYSLIFLAFFFIIPIQFYFLGDGYGFGIQGFIYRYQITIQGSSLIPISYEVGYIIDGRITGKSIYSIMVWAIGSFLYAIGLLCYLLTFDIKTSKWYKTSMILMLFSLALIVFSIIIQYGPFFVGAAGISIPIGIPLLFGVTCLTFLKRRKINKN